MITMCYGAWPNAFARQWLLVDNPKRILNLDDRI